LNATLLRFPSTGGSPTIHATGLRNVFGLARHPQTGDLFVGDNEWNLHPSQPLEGDELNRISQNGDYGFPVKFGAPSPGQSFAPPVVQLPPRTAPCGMEFNPNSGVSGYANELYMALFSTNVATVVRIPLWYGSLSGLPAGVLESFATGFVNPIDLLFLVDGSLLRRGLFRASPLPHQRARRSHADDHHAADDRHHRRAQTRGPRSRPADSASSSPRTRRRRRSRSLRGSNSSRIRRRRSSPCRSRRQRHLQLPLARNARRDGLRRRNHRRPERACADRSSDPPRGRRPRSASFAPLATTPEQSILFIPPF
jgi:hypothetical protein